MLFGNLPLQLFGFLLDPQVELLLELFEFFRVPKQFHGGGLAFGHFVFEFGGVLLG